MLLHVLGCSGGVGHGLRTTSLLVDNDMLIDAGSGVGDLQLAEMGRIRHVFLTHSHLDHVAFLPLLLDSVFDKITSPVVVYGRKETLVALRHHVFNGVMWPDFAILPDPDQPVLRFVEMNPGEVIQVSGRIVEMIAVNHTVPAAGYRVASTTGASFAFSGDTTINDSFWSALNRHKRLDLLLLEATFPNRDRRIAELARHYTPNLLRHDLDKLHHDPPLYFSHFGAGQEQEIFAECQSEMAGRNIAALQRGACFEL